MINLHERMLPTSAGVEPATSWSPVGRRIQLSHRGRQKASVDSGKGGAIDMIFTARQLQEKMPGTESGPLRDLCLPYQSI